MRVYLPLYVREGLDQNVDTDHVETPVRFFQRLDGHRSQQRTQDSASLSTSAVTVLSDFCHY